MKKLLLLVLVMALPALAAWKEYLNAQAGFRASYPEKVVQSRVEDVIWYTGGDFSIGVLPRTWAKSRYGLLKDFTSKGPDWAKGNLARTEIEVDGLPGLELSGVSQKGGPVLMHLVSTPMGGYAIVGASYDMKENLQFVDSFRFVKPMATRPMAPKKPAATK